MTFVPYTLPRDITRFYDKATYLTILRWGGKREPKDITEILKSVSPEQRSRNRHAYWARVQARGAEEFMATMRKSI